MALVAVTTALAVRAALATRNMLPAPPAVTDDCAVQDLVPTAVPPPEKLIATVADKSTGIIWAVSAYQTTVVPGADGTAIGTGNQNTIDIVAQNGAGSTFAAGLCSNLVEGGYSDWYLPSKDELNKLFLNHVAIGGFETTTRPYYWSSSEIQGAASSAWGQKFDDDYQSQYGVDKLKNTFRVRAVRAF